MPQAMVNATLASQQLALFCMARAFLWSPLAQLLGLDRLDAASPCLGKLSPSSRAQEPPLSCETEILGYETLVSKDGGNRDWGTTRGHPHESEYTVIAVYFYNNIKTYLAELTDTDIRGLEDIVQYNYDIDGSQGGMRVSRQRRGTCLEFRTRRFSCIFGHKRH